MSEKKRIKPGRIEAGSDGHSIVVHFITEITHLDEDGVALGTDKTPDKREINVARQLRGMCEKDIPTVAQQIVEKCRYIPATKTKQVEQVLSKLLLGEPTDAFAGSNGHARSSGSRESFRGSHGTTCRGSFFGGSDDIRISRMSPSLQDALQLSALLPEAHICNVDDYANELYEERMEAKTLGAQRLLRVCTEVRNLDDVSEHSTLLGVLSRELRENAKRSHELTVAITGIFLCLAHFSKFHPVLVRHQCNDVTMRVVEYESKRRTVLTKEIELKRGRLVAIGSQASAEDSTALSREEMRYRAVLDRQDRLLQLCLLVLQNLTEGDLAVEKMLVGRRICKFLKGMLDRTNEDLLLVVLNFLHKLTKFEENKDQLIQQADALIRLAELAAHPSISIALLAMRVCYNVSFDARARHVFTSQTSLLSTVVVAAKMKAARKVAMKLIYHLTMDAGSRTAIVERSFDCIALALHLVVSSSESRVDKDAAAICVNLAAHKACAMAIVEQELFPRVAVRAVQFADPLLLKVLRHMCSHRTVRPRLLEVLAADVHGGSTWLHELVVLSTSSAATPDLLAESMGILANLECETPEVAWPELIEAGLLELLERLLISGNADDDVLLECIMLISILALDVESAPLLAASKVPAILPSILTDKQEDYEILQQLFFALRCMLLHEDTCEVMLNETDVPDRILDLLQEAGDQGWDTPGWQVIQAAAEKILELIVDADGAGAESHWALRIKAFRFEMHNDEWCNRLQQCERPQDVKSSTSGANSTGRRSWMRWTDTEGLADRCWGNMPGFGGAPPGVSPALVESGSEGSLR